MQRRSSVQSYGLGTEGEASIQTLVEKALKDRMAEFRGIANKVTFLGVGLIGEVTKRINQDSLTPSLHMQHKNHTTFIHELNRQAQLVECCIVGLPIETWHD